MWAAVKSDAGNVSLNTCKSERRKLDWIRAGDFRAGCSPALRKPLEPKAFTAQMRREMAEALAAVSRR